jgi:peroxiredoxin
VVRIETICVSREDGSVEGDWRERRNARMALLSSEDEEVLLLLEVEEEEVEEEEGK